MDRFEATPAMPPSPLHRLFAQLLDRAALDAPPPAETVTSRIDAAGYFAPAYHQAELDRIFRRLPLCLGHSDQLREPGDMVARDLFGLPLLLTRDRAGALNLLLNVCRHRGARIVRDEGADHRPALMCPYHNWTYELTGRLRGLPCAETFPALDRDGYGLRRLPAVERHGLIWAVLDPAAEAMPDIDGYLAGLGEDFDRLGLPGQRFFRQRAVRRRCNWKLVMDAFQESYHVKRLHAKTVGPFFLDALTTGEPAGPHQRAAVGRETLEAARGRPMDEWDLRNHVTVTHVVFPNTILIFHPDYVSHMGVFPTAPDETLFVHTMVTPHAARSDKERDHWDRSFRLIDEGVFHAEDLFIAEQIQIGLASGANRSFTLGGLEQGIRRFHDTVDRVIAGGAAARDRPGGAAARD